MSDTQKGNRIMRHDLEVRTNLNAKKQLTPDKNLEMWDKIIKASIKNLEFQLRQMKSLNSKLVKLGKSCLRIQSELKTLISRVRRLWWIGNLKSSFNSLLTHSRVLTTHASSITSKTKTLDGSLDQSYHSIKSGFSRAELKE